MYRYVHCKDTAENAHCKDTVASLQCAYYTDANFKDMKQMIKTWDLNLLL
jgi:hypothetical protein